MLVAAASKVGQKSATAPARSAPGRAPANNPEAAKASAPTLQKFSFDTVEVDAAGNVKSRRKGEAESYQEDLGGGVKLEMVKIPAGQFMMGASSEQAEQLKKDVERYCDGCDGAKTANIELPQHRVSVAAFYIGKFEITQAQWKAVMGRNPSNFKKDDLPVELVTWNDCVRFCKLLSQKTGRQYRMPSEAEWEYACRGGSSAAFAFGDNINTDIVNYDGGFPYGAAPKGLNRNTTTAVGSLGIANAFGLYDMHGNVYEWCQDIWHENYQGAPTDGNAWMSGGDQAKRVLKGGSWDVNGLNCRSSYRFGDYPDARGKGVSLGVRIAATQ